MKSHSLFMEWKNQYCWNDHLIQGNLQIWCNPYQMTNDIFHRTKRNNFKICREIQKTPNIQSNLEKEKTPGSIILSDCRVTTFKTVPLRDKSRYTDQWNRAENPEVNPHTYSQSTTKEASTCNGEKRVSSISGGCWGNWTVTCKRTKLDMISHHMQK